MKSSFHCESCALAINRACYTILTISCKFATDVLDNGVAAACWQYGIPLVAYSPLCRGFLTGEIKSFDDIPKDSFLRNLPRFQPGGNFENNIKLVRQVEELAKQKGCTPAQLAVSWVRALNGRPGMPAIIPIPGATRAERIRENIQEVKLTDEEMNSVDQILNLFKPAGNRYPDFVPMET